MLTSLAVRDIVLIRRLDLAFAGGLCVLTGETGAGKSIVLDALGLALGGRADRGLVRAGAEQGSVTACFDPPANHPAWSVLAEQALGEGGGEGARELVLRRSLGADGRSKAFVNDEPVSTQLLRRLGDTLVEVHGQNEQRGLLNPAVHRELLDAFGELDGAAAALRDAWRAWADAAALAERLRAGLDLARRDEEYLRHRARELEDLAPEPGEEQALAEARHRLASREKLAAALDEALTAVAGTGGARERLAQAERRLERVRPLAGEIVGPAADALARALLEVDEAEAAVAAAVRSLDLDAGRLDEIEARLFALRDAARKHRVPVDALPGLLDETRRALTGLATGTEAVEAAERATRAARAGWAAQAAVLSERRRAAAGRLAEAVTAELPALKLERARLDVRVEPLPEPDWGPGGTERIGFEVATNPGQPPGPLARIASGGELSRLMLALKAVLARLGAAETLVFDEVDAGIGGATAAAVGERLARLAGERQVVVVTHAPQIAALADHHLTVTKQLRGGETTVDVRPLDPDAREREIARMLAGAEVTEAARAAARSLLARRAGA
jgi:DNA repair protein RecN (Recombination protein N)